MSQYDLLIDVVTMVGIYRCSTDFFYPRTVGSKRTVNHGFCSSKPLPEQSERKGGGGEV